MTYHFFLGGRDLEMVEIARLLHKLSVPYSDLNLAWGASVSAYAAEIEVLPLGVTAVAVELSDDMPKTWPARARLKLIDHHNERANKDSSLAQVFALLNRPRREWSRHYSLVAANDVGHIEALVKAGANLEEQFTIRAADRKAQGISQHEEAEGISALAAAEVLDGCLTFVRLVHGRMATVTDPLALDPAFTHLPGQVLVLSPGELGYFGSYQTVYALNKLLPGGWWGGNPPKTGFWGINADEKQIDSFVEMIRIHKPYLNA